MAEEKEKPAEAEPHVKALAKIFKAKPEEKKGTEKV